MTTNAEFLRGLAVDLRKQAGGWDEPQYAELTNTAARLDEIAEDVGGRTYEAGYDDGYREGHQDGVEEMDR